MTDRLDEIRYRTNWDADFIKGNPSADPLLVRSVEHRKWLIEQVESLRARERYDGRE